MCGGGGGNGGGGGGVCVVCVCVTHTGVLKMTEACNKKNGLQNLWGNTALFILC